MLKKIFQKSISLTVLTLFCSIVGYLNQLILAYYFGATQNMDNYLFAISIPTFVAALLCAAVSYSVIPEIVKCGPSIESRKEYLSSLMFCLTFLSIILAVLGILFSNISIQQAQESKSIRILTIISWGSAVFQIINSLINAISVADGKFEIPVVCGYFPYIGSISLAYLTYNYLGIYSVALGVLIGNFLTIIYSLSKNKSYLPFLKDYTLIRMSIIKAFFKNGFFTSVAMTCFSSYSIIDAYYAPMVGVSALSYLGYAQRIIIGLGNLIIAGPSSVIVPYFARLSKDKEICKKYTILTLLTVCLGASIFAMLISLNSSFIVKLLFQRGAFSENDTKIVASILRIMAFGMIPMLTSVIAYRLLYSFSLVIPQFLIGLLWSVFYSLLSHFLYSDYGVIGIAYSYLLSWTISLILLLFYILK